MRWFVGLVLMMVLTAPARAQEIEPVHPIVDVPMLLFSERQAERMVQAWRLRSAHWYACAWATIETVERGEHIGKTAWAINSFMRQDGPVTETSCNRGSNGIVVFVNSSAQAEEWADEAVTVLRLRPDLHYITFVYGARKIRWSSREIEVPATFTIAWMKEKTDAPDDTR